MIYTLAKYKENLSIRNYAEVWSYDTHVATIVGAELIEHGWWSPTTSKHVNYVADQLDLDVVRQWKGVDV